MGAQSPTSPEVKLDSADRLLRQTSGRPDVQSLELGALLSEFAEWLADDRQWHTGSTQNWSSLIEDVADRVVLLRDLSNAPIQQRLGSSVDDLKRLRGVLAQAGVSRDEALRRQLRRAQDEVRAASKEPDLLVAGWRRVLEWEQTNPVRAAQGMAALRDLADLQGHNSKALFNRLSRVLTGVARDIAALTGEAYTDESPPRRDETADTLLSFGEELLSIPAQPVGGVVWLEYLVADLHSPWMLELGPSVVLYQDDLLRGMLLHQPDDPRLPTDLRDGHHVLDASWFKADNEEALSVERDIPGDPRVYLRLELPEMPPGELLERARETAEFLVAFGALGGDNHALWTVGDSYLVRGWERSTSAATAVRDKHEPHPFRRDGTAFVLATHATELGRHLPLRSPELLVAGRLLVWLRQTGASDPASRIVLCDRVVEQVCGWAGVANPADFAAEFLETVVDQHADTKSHC